MENPLVTVITPSYNQGRFIKATIESVLTQDYPNIDYIIVDGGSTDETLAILRSYEGRFRWLSESDRGQSDALNKGLRLAQGTILTFINSDDLLLPGAITTIVDYFMTHPDACAVYGEVQLIDGEGKAFSLLPARPFSLREAFSGNQDIAQQGTCWRREVTDQIGEFDTTLQYTMDLEYWLRMAIYGCIPSCLPGTRAAFRIHSSSKTVSQQIGFARDWYTMIEKLFALPNISPEIQSYKAAALAHARWAMLLGLKDEGNQVEVRRLLREILRHETNRRRVLALAMYIDSYLHTNLGKQIHDLDRRAKGRLTYPL